MRVTKLSHACAVVQSDQSTVVIDPGGIGEFPDLSGVDGVLITHIHFDHVAPEPLAAAMKNGSFEVWAPAQVAEALGGGDRVHVVADGDEFTVGDIAVSVHGSKHARMHPEAEPDANVGYLLDGRVFHPGDALTVIEGVDLLLTPVNAPWLRAVDLMEYVRAARPKQIVAIHDGLLNDVGLNVVGRILAAVAEDSDVPASRVEPGTTIDV